MIDLVHIREFSDRIAEGWTMVPGYPLEPGDTRVTMQSPDHQRQSHSNNSAGAVSRNLIRYAGSSREARA